MTIDRLLARFLILPTLVSSAIFVYGFIGFTFLVSLTNSSLMPRFNFVGLRAYEVIWTLNNWQVAIANLAVFGVLYIGICTALGCGLAILLDQKVRGENFFRPVFLYPMALSFIVTGTAWRWFLNPGLGLERSMQNLGWESFRFDWIVNPDMAIYTVVIAGVWQSTGFCMAMFLAGLRSVDREIIKAATLDGASGITLYRRIVLPLLRPTLLSVLVVQLHLTIKAYDLVISLTGGGPGNSTQLPATFMYDFTFTRSQMAIGSASSILMLVAIAALIVPYLWNELKAEGKSR
jgi:glucose/mannose transport system permease protein